MAQYPFTYLILNTLVATCIIAKEINCKGPVIRGTFFFNLSCNIVVLQVETLCCTYYCLHDQLVSQQWCCKFAESCTYDWSVVYTALSLLKERLQLSVWAFCMVKLRKGLENEIEKCTCGNGFHQVKVKCNEI